MSFDGLIMTKLGKAELIKATDTGSLSFTHVALGDGVTSELFNLKEELSHEIARVPIASVERKDDRIILSVDYTNKSFEKGFYLREIGIIGNEKLCYYDNSGSDAEYIDPGNEVVTKERRLRIELIVSETANVETTVSSGLYALDKDVQQLKEKIETDFADVVTCEDADDFGDADDPDSPLSMISQLSKEVSELSETVGAITTTKF